VLGSRLERYRLQANITQAELAAKAGISLGTLKRAEGGKGLSLLNLVAVLRALDKVEALEGFLPEPPLDPLAVRDRRGHYRQRASKKRRELPEADDNWSWGDEG
jgi:transcriptional regulator with XRE-family HTH domain